MSNTYAPIDSCSKRPPVTKMTREEYLSVMETIGQHRTNFEILGGDRPNLTAQNMVSIRASLYALARPDHESIALLHTAARAASVDINTIDRLGWEQYEKEIQPYL